MEMQMPEILCGQLAFGAKAMGRKHGQRKSDWGNVPEVSGVAVRRTPK